MPFASSRSSRAHTSPPGGWTRRSARTGPADDSLLGNAGHDTLFGGRGRDTLRGGAGNDYLNAGPGADSVFGDAGNDQFFALDQTADTLFGGDGVDRLKADQSDVASDMETVLS
jgi:hypothetical protein